MSLFGEFHVPADAFALAETLATAPELIIETERVAATEEVLTPYFWVSGEDGVAFEDAAADDPSIRHLRHIDDVDRASLYRAEWTENVESIVYAYTTVGATILEASAQGDEWELSIRFNNRDRLDQFREYCDEHDIPFTLTQLYERAHPRAGGQYGLTTKQHEALVTAWEMGYYRSTDVSLTDVADSLGISQQSLSRRLQRGYENLIQHALAVTPPSEDPKLEE
ncbi:helix-turn-helix domain-containing protein [Halopiger aswanensis]|uniref:Putative DNA binding protein n=1 Tax=Halopiger aswanensis TaxID=148449 RepID=A0A419WCW8_9EURY|nr:bacterio-opsin activator domain-containing protein [Halopiger aswanensis]RKD93353.1 putative DNA binding protein [Halopiger aswanensis]